MTGHMRVAITKTVFFTTHARLVEATANVSGGNSPEIPLPRQEGGYLLDGCRSTAGVTGRRRRTGIHNTMQTHGPHVPNGTAQEIVWQHLYHPLRGLRLPALRGPLLPPPEGGTASCKFVNAACEAANSPRAIAELSYPKLAVRAWPPCACPDIRYFLVWHGYIQQRGSCENASRFSGTLRIAVKC